MMNTAFALATSAMPFGDRAAIAGTVALQGMLAIFAVLAILWAAVEIMHRALQGKKEKSVGDVIASPKAANTAMSQNDETFATTPAPSEDEGAIVAAITAAITAARAEVGSSAPFRVVSFKRVAGSTSLRNF